MHQFRIYRSGRELLARFPVRLAAGEGLTGSESAPQSLKKQALVWPADRAHAGDRNLSNRRPLLATRKTPKDKRFDHRQYMTGSRKGVRLASWALENIVLTRKPQELDELIEAATELAELKPIYFRLTKSCRLSLAISTYSSRANEVKQRLMARGTVLKQQGSSHRRLPPGSASDAGSANRFQRHSLPDSVPPAPAASRTARNITEGRHPAFPYSPYSPVRRRRLEPPAPQPTSRYRRAGAVRPNRANRDAHGDAVGAVITLHQPSASGEQPPLALGVTSPEPPSALPAPAKPAAQPPSILLPPIPCRPHRGRPHPNRPWRLFCLSSPLFDFAPPEQPTRAFAVAPGNPPQPAAPPPAAKRPAQPPPLPASFLDAEPPVAPAGTPFPLESACSRPLRRHRPHPRGDARETAAPACAASR